MKLCFTTPGIKISERKGENDESQCGDTVTSMCLCWLELTVLPARGGKKMDSLYCTHLS